MGKKINTKILINGRFLTQAITGVQRYAHEIVQAMDNLLGDLPHIEAMLVSPRLQGPSPIYQNIRHIQTGKFKGHLWEQTVLPKYIGDATLFCPGNSAPILSLLTKRRVVVTVHDLSYLYFPNAYSRTYRFFYNQLMPFILRKAAAVITVSKAERASILKHYPFVQGRLLAIQNGGLPVGVTSQESTTEPRDEQYVLYIGALSKRKNFPGMFDVACRLARERGLQFVFVGGVPDGIVDSLAQIPSETRSQIKFLGQVNDWEVLMRHYRKATCLFFPSFYEASPLPPIEAMACGCPVIASAIPSLLERCGDAALYCDPHDVADMCRVVETLIDDASLGETLRKKGYRQAEKFSWHNCARQTLEVLLN